jgi:hypothetical protein
MRQLAALIIVVVIVVVAACRPVPGAGAEATNLRSPILLAARGGNAGAISDDVRPGLPYAARLARVHRRSHRAPEGRTEPGLVHDHAVNPPRRR